MSLGSVLVAMLIFWFLFIVGGLFVLFMWAIWVNYASRLFKIEIVKPDSHLLNKRMQSKPIATIAVLLILVTSLSITGCTNNTTNTATSPSPQAHDATLERYINVTKQAEYNNKTKEILAWLVTWNNDSSVTILETVKNRTDNSSVSGNTTLINFQSNQDATNYLSAFDKSDYSLISTSFKTSDAPTLRNVTGHDPSVYAEYIKTEG